MLYQLSYARMKKMQNGLSQVVARRVNHLKAWTYKGLGSSLREETDGGGRWIRTTVGVCQQIYSLPPLATRACHHDRLDAEAAVFKLSFYR